jgi:hypothetical protein
MNQAGTGAASTRVSHVLPTAPSARSQMRRPALTPALCLWAAAAGVVTALSLFVRLAQRHASLLYPDGYQYLLQARGIAEHLRPLTRMGPGGDLFVPSIDAADKPLYPALVAALHVAGVSPRPAAGLISALAAAAVPLLAGLLAWRLTGSRLAALLAAGLLLASPALSFWSGFAGPDPLAQAFALAALVALSGRRIVLAGVLAGLTCLSRPEYLLVVLAVLAAAALSRRFRPQAGRAALALTATLVLLVGLLRPPLGWPAAPAALAAGTAGTLLLVVAAWQLSRSRAAAVAAALLTPALALALALHGSAPALVALWRSEAPLLVLVAVALPLAAAGPRRRETLLVLAAALALAAVYVQKNPALERYLVQLWPSAALLVAFASSGRPARLRRPLAGIAALAAAAAVAVTLLTTPARPQPGAGLFPALAGRLQGERGVLYSATPDAYALLLPKLGQRQVKPGSSGLILLDAAQRYYQPGLRVQGKLLERLQTDVGFLHQDGTIDTGDAFLYLGRVRHG